MKKKNLLHFHLIGLNLQQQILTMSDTSNSVGKYWLMFLISLVACILFLIFLPEWFWVTLPFLFTGFVYGMRWV